MRVTISKGQLLLGLQRVQNVVERRNTMPILSNALLKTEAGGLSVISTDLEVGIQSVLPAEIQEEGAITVKARSLLDIVRELPDTNIQLQTMENSRLEITAKKSVFNIVGLPFEDFPEVPSLSAEDPTQYVRMNGTVVISMLDKTLYAASTDEARYHLNGVYFETVNPTPADQNGQNEQKKCFRMVATDAHRLALVESQEVLFDEAGWKVFEEGVIVPRKGLNELRRLLAEGREDFFVCIRNRTLYVKRENIFLSMRLIEGKYADYRRIIPEPSPTPVTLNREEFLSSLKRIALMANDKSRSLTLQLNPGILQLSSQSPELGDAQEDLSIAYEGEGIKIGFNSRYLIDAVSTMDGESVVLELRGKQNPGVIRSASGPSHIGVVMPMRI